MYVVSDEFNQAANAMSRLVSVRATFNGTQVIDGAYIKNISINERIIAKDYLSMGETCSNKLELEMFMPTEAIPINNASIFIEIGLNNEYCPMGKFYAADYESNDGYKTVKITAYDYFSKLTDKWQSNLTFPASISDVLSELPIELAITEYPDIYVEYIDCTVRELIGYIAGLLGCNARFDRQGKLAFKWFEGNYPIDSSVVYMNGLTETAEENFVIGSLTSGTKELPLTVGSGKGITFENPFMTQEILDSIYSKVLGQTIKPCRLKYRCNPAIEVGDICNDNIFIMSQEISVGAGMNCTISSFGGEENIVMFESPTDKKISKAYKNLTESFKTATQIMMGIKGGYYQLLVDEVGFPYGWEIRDTYETTITTKLWRFTMGGLAFSNDGGQTFSEAAITLDGHISANAITTGYLSSDRIRIEGEGDDLTNYLKVQASEIEQNLKVQYESAIEQTARDLTIKISENYVAQDDFEKEQSRIDDISSDLGEVSETTQKINNTFSFTTEGLIIGRADSDIKSVQDNDSYMFIDRANNPILAIDTKGVNSPTVNVEKQITFYGQWAQRRGIYVDSVGYNLNDVWIGG